MTVIIAPPLSQARFFAFICTRLTACLPSGNPYGVSTVTVLESRAPGPFMKRLTLNSSVVWSGNWGDEERTEELQEFLIGPAAALPDRKFVVYGVRYPEAAIEQLRKAGIEYRGYLPNLL